MSGTYAVTMGDRGRLVVPAELRDRLALGPGTSLLLVESADGVILVTRDQAKQLIRRQLAGQSLVAELLADRRSAAALEAAG